jgi:hypothetical protein
MLSGAIAAGIRAVQIARGGSTRGIGDRNSRGVRSLAEVKTMLGGAKCRQM